MQSINILISGGSGFIGSAFSDWVQDPSHTDGSNVNITWLTRDTTQAHPDYVTMMNYDELATTTEAIFDVIINIAGAGIADKRWSDERKHTLMQSRLQPTQALINYIATAKVKPKLLISGSAIGWYGARGDAPLDEDSPPPSNPMDDFAHKLCEAWEQEASIALGLGVPVALVRTGIVIHPDGGMVAKLLLPFKMGTGGKLGDGEQYMSWISREDWIRAAWFIINQHLNSSVITQSIENTSKQSKQPVIYNFTAPNPVTNLEFTNVMGDWLNRPTLMTLPAPVLKLLFGEMSTLLIDGQKVLPKALLEAGFEFKHTMLKQALTQQN